MLYPFRKNQPYGWLFSSVSLLLLVGLWVLMQGSAMAQEGSKTAQASVEKEFDVIDTQYQEVIDQFLRLYVKKYQQPPAAGIEALAVQVATMGHFEALAAIRVNLDLVLQNTAKKEFDLLLHFLYQANDTATIQVLTDQLKKSGEPVARSRNYFVLAQYYEARKNWPGVQGALGKVNARDLSPGDNHYYHLLMGYALQNIKDHRQSLKHYQQIPRGSPYYAHAKLNEGTANLRQGWWTEAHMEFERAIQFLTENPVDEALRNRLLVVLGYSQLRYEFYRDARNSLRKVAVNSESANKALMGIGLAAAYQKDFVGAANAFRLLTEKPIADLSVEEAFLLLPYAQEEAGNKADAGLAYQKAIDHYQRKLDLLHKLQTRIVTADHFSLLKEIQDTEARAEELFGSSVGIPGYIQRNYSQIATLHMSAGEFGLDKSLQSLRQRYHDLMRDVTAQNLEARRAIINSYLSQAKFGMAKLYDTP